MMLQRIFGEPQNTLTSYQHFKNFVKATLSVRIKDL